MFLSQNFRHAFLGEIIESPKGSLNLGGGEGRCKTTWGREFKRPWREASPPHNHDAPSTGGLVTCCRSKGSWPVVSRRARNLMSLSPASLSLSSTGEGSLGIPSTGYGYRPWTGPPREMT